MAEIVTLTPNPAIDLSTSIDRIVPMRKLRCTAQRRDPGGGGVNVARVVKRFGGDVEAILPVGGFTGQLLRRLIDDEKIPNRDHRSRSRNARRLFGLRTEHGAAVPLRPAWPAAARSGMARLPRRAGRQRAAAEIRRGQRQPAAGRAK